MDLDKWKQETLKDLNQKRQAALRAKGKNPYFKFPEGDTEIMLLPDKPVESKGGTFGLQYVFSIKVKNETFDFPVKPNSPLYRRFVEYIDSKPVKLIVARVGLKMDTRYSVRPAK